MKHYLQPQNFYRLKDGRKGRLIGMDFDGLYYIFIIDNKKVKVKEDDVVTDAENYEIEYISQNSNYKMCTGQVTWLKHEIDLYWPEEVKYWLDDTAEPGDKLVLRNVKTNEIVKETIK